MMIVHSIKSVLRTPKKSILFLFLLMVLTCFISIGAGMYDSARNMLSDADEIFTSMVQLNYLSENFGEEKDFFEKMNSELAEIDLTKLSKHKSVKTVGLEKDAWAFLEGETIKRNNTLLSNYAIFKVSSIKEVQEGVYQGIVDNNLFGRKIKENTRVVFSYLDDEGNQVNKQLIPGHQYLVVGTVADGKNPTPIIIPGLSSLIDGIPSLVDLNENPDFLQTEEGMEVMRLKEAMEVVNYSLPVILVSDLEAMEGYYFDDILLMDGRIFEPSEYTEGSNQVILISQTIADFYKLKTNDQITLKLHYNKSGVGLSDYLTKSEYSQEAVYTIAGIFSDNEDIKYNIYMPDADWIEQEHHSTTPIRYIVKNGEGEALIKELKNSFPMNMELVLYDQGYGEAVKPILALKNNAVMILSLGLLSGIAILTLFSYLYVTKQKDTLRTMLSLGTSKRRAVSYILFGSMLLVLCASGIGAYISSAFLTKVTQMLFSTLQDNYITDLRYSERAIGLNANFIPQVRASQWLPVFGIVAVLMISIIILLCFTLSILKENSKITLPRKRRQKKVYVANRNKISRMRFGKLRPIPLKFALLSTIRSPGRSLIIPVISLLLSLFIIFLGLLSGRQQEELATVYDRIPVTAYMTNYKNGTRDLSGLDLEYDIYKLINPKYTCRTDTSDWDIYMDGSEMKIYGSEKAKSVQEQLLNESEYFQDMLLYNAVHYEYMGISRTKDGVINEALARIPEQRAHKNAYGYDWFVVEVNKMPKLAYADDLRYTPDFFNTDPKVEFLEGYSYESLRSNRNLGIISQNLATTNGIKLGDTVRITGWYVYGEHTPSSVIDFLVIGIYDEEWRTDTIYLPWNMSFEHNYSTGFSYVADGVVSYGIMNEARPWSLRSATFVIKNTQELSDFRDYIENLGYSRIGKMRLNRRAIVIQDKKLVDTIQNLRNHIRVIETIKPVMLVLFGVIGFVVSYLLMKHRVSELAIMRSMGARKRQVFLSYFLEQLILFVIGLLPAVAYACILPGQIALYGASLLYFILSYLLGAAIALIFMNRAKILDILFTKE